MKVYQWPVKLIFLFPFFLACCYQTPEFSTVPSISYESINFKEGEGFFDTLILRVKFQDGDGDLGLAGDETFPPYEPFLIVTKPGGGFYQPGELDSLVYNCYDYRNGIIIGSDTLTTDTVYAPINIRHYNIYADLYTKQQGSFNLFNFRKELCVQPIGWGRFPRLKENFSTDGPLEGVIEFKIKSNTWLTKFSNDTLMLKVQIRDRALHLSNEIETPEFTLLGLIEANE